MDAGGRIPAPRSCRRPGHAFLVGCGAASPDFSKTAEYRHPSIPDGVAPVDRLGREDDFAVEATEIAARFPDEDHR
jgi:cytochrome c